MIRAKVKLSTVAHRGYATFFWLIHAESNELGIVVKQMLTEVVDRGRKLYSVNGSSLACYPSLPLCPSTSSPHNLFSNSHYEECTSFPITQLPGNERKFIPKVLKVHINRIQLYLYSASPRNQCKLKP